MILDQKVFMVPRGTDFHIMLVSMCFHLWNSCHRLHIFERMLAALVSGSRWPLTFSKNEWFDDEACPASDSFHFFSIQKQMSG